MEHANFQCAEDSVNKCVLDRGLTCTYLHRLSGEARGAKRIYTFQYTTFFFCALIIVKIVW